MSAPAPTDAAAERRYGGRTAAERRERRRGQLVEAAVAVVAERGVAAATVQDVCRAAGLSQRYLYEAFTDLDELFEAALDDLATAVERTLAEAFHAEPGAEPADRIRTALRALLDWFGEDPARARVALVESLVSPRTRRRRHRSLAAFARLATAELRSMRPGGAEAAASGADTDVAVVVLVGGIAEALMAAVDADPDRPAPPRDALVERLTALFLAAAGPVPGAATGGGRPPSSGAASAEAGA